MVKASKGTLEDLTGQSVQSPTDAQLRKDVAGRTGTKKPVQPPPEKQRQDGAAFVRTTGKVMNAHSQIEVISKQGNTSLCLGLRPKTEDRPVVLQSGIKQTLRLAGLMILICGAPLFATEPRVIQVERMAGLETAVEKALLQQELRPKVINEQQQAEFRVQLRRLHPSPYAEMLYKNKLGRTEDHLLELVDLESRKVTAHLSFRMTMDSSEREGIAGEFARRVKTAIARERR